MWGTKISSAIRGVNMAVSAPAKVQKQDMPDDVKVCLQAQSCHPIAWLRVPASCAPRQAMLAAINQGGPQVAMPAPVSASSAAGEASPLSVQGPTGVRKMSMPEDVKVSLVRQYRVATHGAGG